MGLIYCLMGLEGGCKSTPNRNDPWIPATRPRPANKNLQNNYPDLTVDSLINSESRTWNLQAIRALEDPNDVKIIESIPLS